MSFSNTLMKCDTWSQFDTIRHHMGPEKFARIKSVILCCRPQPQLPPASLIKQISQMQSLEKLRLTGVLRLIDQPPYNDDYEWYINSLKHVFGNLPFAKAVLQYCNPNKIHIEVELDIITEYMRPYKKTFIYIPKTGMIKRMTPVDAEEETE